MGHGGVMAQQGGEVSELERLQAELAEARRVATDMWAYITVEPDRDRQLKLCELIAKANRWIGEPPEEVAGE